MRGLLLIVMSLSLAGMCLAQTGGEHPAAAAARKRAEAIKSVVVVFDMKEVREAARSGSPGAGTTATAFQPRALDTQLVMTSEGNRLVVSGQKVRHELNHPLLNRDTGKVVEQREVAATSGSDGLKIRTPPTGGNRANRVGIVSDREHLVIHQFDYYYPLLLACNGVDAKICDIPLAKYTAAGASQSVNGVTCERYQRDYADGAGVTELWASPQDEYLPRRVRYLNQGKLVKQIDVTEFRKVGGHAYPAQWKLTRYSASGVVTSTRTISVREFVVNPELTDDEFTIHFPPGLDIEDVILQKRYLVRDDGSWLELKPGEENTEAVRADARSPWWLRNWWVLLASLVAVTILTLGLIRWSRRRKSRLADSPPTLSK